MSEDSDAIVGINVTPLVDVCLVLVIIFMVTAPLFMDPSLEIVLPKARTQEGEEKERVTITMSADGQIALNNKVIKTIEEFSGELKLKIMMSADKYVVLRADRDALHGRLTEMMALAKEAGAMSLTIATEQKSKLEND